MAKQKNIDPEELRYNYLGFEYVPGKLKEFWASDDERKSYLDKIRQRLKSHHSIERDASVVNARQINPADRIIISVAALIMVLSLFIPYYHFEAFGARVMGSPLSFFAHIGYISNFVAWGNLMVKLVFVMAIFMIIFTPVVGVLTLIALNTGLNSPGYFARLKTMGRLNILAIFLYIVLFILIASGQPNPFGSLGVPALGENLSFGSLIGLASFSMWLSIGAHLLGSLPAMEL
jgi:hypothetical protein